MNRMKKVLLLALAASAFAASNASAVTLVNPDGSVAQPYQSWADASRVPTVEARLVVSRSLAPCGDKGPLLGCSARSGWIAITNDAGWVQQRATLMHELGHQYDYAMPDWKRHVFGKLTYRQWDAEYFADMYAICADADLSSLAVRRNTDLSIRRTGRLLRQSNH